MKELKAKFGFKLIYGRRKLVISSEDMEPTTFDYLRKAAKAVSVSYGALRYAKNKERDFVKKDEKMYKRLVTHLKCLKDRAHSLNLGIPKCPYGQTFDYASEIDWGHEVSVAS